MLFPLGHHFFGTSTFHETRHPFVFRKMKQIVKSGRVEWHCGVFLGAGSLLSFPRRLTPRNPRNQFPPCFVNRNKVVNLSYKLGVKWQLYALSMIWKYIFFKQSRGVDNCLQEVFSNGFSFCERQPPGGGLGLHISRLCRQKLQERKKINCWPSADIIVGYICCHAV